MILMFEMGEILTEVRYKRFQYATDAVKAMKEKGCSISYDQYKALERGKMPNKRQMHEVCSFFALNPNCWFMGDCEDAGQHCDIYNGLSPIMKKLAENSIHAIVEADKEQKKKLPH